MQSYISRENIIIKPFYGVPGGSSVEQVACMAQAHRESGACVLSEHII